jgi:hypothetical protein
MFGAVLVDRPVIRNLLISHPIRFVLWILRYAAFAIRLDPGISGFLSLMPSAYTYFCFTLDSRYTRDMIGVISFFGGAAVSYLIAISYLTVLSPIGLSSLDSFASDPYFSRQISYVNVCCHFTSSDSANPFFSAVLQCKLAQTKTNIC